MYRVMFLLASVILMACSSDNEQPEPVPDYMFSVFPTNQSCDTINYVKLDFGDSTFYLSDTLTDVKVYDHANQSIIGAALAKTLTSDDEPDVLIKFYYFEDIKKKYDFIKPGSYKFIDPAKLTKPEYKLENIGVHLEYGVLDSYSYFRSRPDSTAFFYVNGKSGDDFQMRLCGEFDVLMRNIYTLDSIRVKGEYSLLFTDYFF